MKKYSLNSIFKKGEKVLGIGAHFDDIENYFGGTLIKVIKQKIVYPKDIYFLICSNGSMGGNSGAGKGGDLTDVRMKEQTQVLLDLRVPKENLFVLDFQDGELQEVVSDLTEKITYYVRKVSPTILLSHTPNEYYVEKENGFDVVHEDHRACGEATFNSFRTRAKNERFYPDQIKDGLKTNDIKKLLICQTNSSNYELDITDVIDEKIALYLNHRSQVKDINKTTFYLKNLDSQKDKFFEKLLFLEKV